MLARRLAGAGIVIGISRISGGNSLKACRWNRQLAIPCCNGATTTLPIAGCHEDGACQSRAATGGSSDSHRNFGFRSSELRFAKERKSRNRRIEFLCTFESVETEER